MPTLFVWLIALLFVGKLKISFGFCPHYGTRLHCSTIGNIQAAHQNHDNEILGSVRIDYSAANEYIRAHYGDKSPRVPLYFGTEESMETVYDARFGAYSRSFENMQPASLKTCGFALISPAGIKQFVDNADWNNRKWIQQYVLSSLQKYLKDLYSGHRTIRHMLFWNPMLRGPSSASNEPRTDNGKTPKASYAALPHIDMDVNAYDKFEDFLDLMENNEMEILDTTASTNHDQGRRQDILDSIQNKNRGFCIVNAWCNVGSHPVRKDPLGLFSVQYDGRPTATAAFPMAAPNMKTSRWYAFSDMTPDEVLLFCQYDRDASWPSDLWHCSLNGVSTTTNPDDLPPRESFDIRCLLVFEEEVPLEQDRFRQANRLGSLLSLEESGCFCEGQFEKRLEEDKLK